MYTQLAFFNSKVEGIEQVNKKPYKIEISEITDENNDGRVDLTDVEYLLLNRKNLLTMLEGDGDFRSEECIALLRQSDVVVTNPPFSLFREYVAQLISYEKSFLIIGHVNALTYKEVFPLVAQNKLWLGVSIHSGDREFRVPKNYPLKAAGYRVDENGIKYIRVKGVRWFTNLDTPKRHENLVLYKTYKCSEYRSYYKYDAIDVNSVAEIPVDYYGIMGVPVTFLDKYNPEQFEIIGLGITQSGLAIGIGTNLTDEEFKQFKKDSAAFRRGTLFYLDENGKAKVPFARILIRRK
jgi:hypothetical protein